MSAMSVQAKVKFALAGLVVALALLPATTQAHYPYESATPPAWWTETLGPPVTGLDGVTYPVDCTLKERLETDEYGSATYFLDWIGPPVPGENDFPACIRAWGGLARSGCSGQAVAYHPADGSEENVQTSWSCAVYLVDEIGARCYRDDFVNLVWTPYDCRAEVLPGWPNSPEAPAGDSLLAVTDPVTCSKRKCSFEVRCENATGDSGCLFFISVGDRHETFTKDVPGFGLERRAPQGGTGEHFDDGQIETLTYKTTKRGRKDIKKHFLDGKRSVKGYWFAERVDKFNEDGPVFEGGTALDGRTKIKLKRGRRVDRPQGHRSSSTGGAV
jgi:hypothetical protein